MIILEQQQFSLIRGFNYLPGYARHGIEAWYYQFDIATIEQEIKAARAHFPKFNTLRFWLSHEAFLRNGDVVGDNFRRVLDICGKYNLKAIPTLFNGCHSVPDFGSISSEQISYFGGDRFEQLYSHYLEKIVGENFTNDVILMWDLCNEPFNNARDPKMHMVWLENAYRYSKSLSDEILLTVGVTPSMKSIEMVENISDILTFHPYHTKNMQWPLSTRDGFVAFVEEVVQFANIRKKPLIASECCWGALDDEIRREIIDLELGELSARKMGFIATWMCHSLALDSHREDCGPVLGAGYMAFVERDGSLRPHHDAFNNY